MSGDTRAPAPRPPLHTQPRPRPRPAVLRLSPHQQEPPGARAGGQSSACGERSPGAAFQKPVPTALTAWMQNLRTV